MPSINLTTVGLIEGKLDKKSFKPLWVSITVAKGAHWQLPSAAERLKEWPHWPGIFKMVTMLAGLFEPFVFPSQLLWLGRKVDTCLGPRGSQYCAANWAKKAGNLPAENRGQRGESCCFAYRRTSSWIQSEKNNKTQNDSEVWLQEIKTVIISQPRSKFSWQVLTFWLPGQSIITLWQKWVKTKTKNWWGWVIFTGSVDADAEKVSSLEKMLGQRNNRKYPNCHIISCKIFQMTVNTWVEVNWSYVNDPTERCGVGLLDTMWRPLHYSPLLFHGRVKSGFTACEDGVCEDADCGGGGCEGVGHSVPANISSSSLLFPLCSLTFPCTHPSPMHRDALLPFAAACQEAGFQFFTLVCLLL